jgi:formylglycine-generating enzyme required for sulfatase activity
MVAIPSWDGGPSMCIDSTEVTNAQYAAFLAAVGTTPSGQPSGCSWKTSYAPGPPTASVPCDPGFDSTSRPNYPVACVDWCDAYAFCQWSGKQLCSDNDKTNGWYWACSSGHKNNYVYGSTYEAGRCVDGTYDASQPVGSATGCESPDQPFQGAFDLLGNVAEWGAECFNDDAGASASCSVVGGGAASVLNGNANIHYSCTGSNVAGTPNGEIVSRNDADPALGFRCCANQ